MAKEEFKEAAASLRAQVGDTIKGLRDKIQKGA